MAQSIWMKEENLKKGFRLEDVDGKDLIRSNLDEIYEKSYVSFYFDFKKLWVPTLLLKHNLLL